MSKGLTIALVASVLVLALGVAGIGAYVFLIAPGTAASSPDTEAAAKSTKKAAEPVFFKTKNFVTDLADKDRLRYVDVTVALAVTDEAALESVKKLEPEIRDVILGQLRKQMAADLVGTTGKEKLAAQLKGALAEPLKEYLQAVYITDLVVQ